MSAILDGRREPLTRDVVRLALALGLDVMDLAGEAPLEPSPSAHELPVRMLLRELNRLPTPQHRAAACRAMIAALRR